GPETRRREYPAEPGGSVMACVSVMAGLVNRARLTRRLVCSPALVHLEPIGLMAQLVGVLAVTHARPLHSLPTQFITNTLAYHAGKALNIGQIASGVGVAHLRRMVPQRLAYLGATALQARRGPAGR